MDNNASVLEGLMFSLFAGIVAVIVALPFTGSPLPVAYLGAVIYAALSYVCWILVVETYPYDEGCEPKSFNGKQVCIALMLPCGTILAIAVAFTCLVIATVWHLYNLAMGRCSYAD